MTEEAEVVVITGASGGIGAALARRLGDEGMRVVLAARRDTELGMVAAEAEVQPGAEMEPRVRYRLDLQGAGDAVGSGGLDDERRFKFSAPLWNRSEQHESDGAAGLPEIAVLARRQSPRACE